MSSFFAAKAVNFFLPRRMQSHTQSNQHAESAISALVKDKHGDEKPSGHVGKAENEQPESDGTSLLHGSYSVTSEPPSYSDLHYQVPCVCDNHQGCCRQHQSTHSSGWRNPKSPSGTEILSRRALAPIHPAVANRLSHENLSCVRRRLKPGTKLAFIPELHYEDHAISKEGIRFYITSEIYFSKGTFLQKHKVECYLSTKYMNSDVRLVGCPHHSLHFTKPTFNEKGSFFRVDTTITNTPPRCPSHPSEKWNNHQGPHVQMVVCSICHSDAECVMKLGNFSLHVRYICYRDLGAGIDPTDAKWLSLLTGEGSHVRSTDRLDLYNRVFRTADDLQRADNERVTHKTPHGALSMGMDTCI